MVHDPVAQRRKGGTEPIERFDTAEQAVAQGQPVFLVVVGEEFVLHFGHVDVGGALALAALALQAEVEGFVDPPAREPLAVQLARQGGPEHVRAAPGAVLLIERGDIGRAHRPHQLLAAGADPVAKLDGAREPAVAREIEVGIDLLSLVCRTEPQVVRHLLVCDDLARIHDAVRVEHGLDRLEGLVQPRAENLLVPLAPHEPVAVLGTDRAAVGHDQVADFFGDGPHARDALGFLEVDERPDVDRPHTGVGVVGGHRAVLVDDIAEVADIVRKLLRRDRSVLHESRRLGIPFHAHEQPESRLPDSPGVRLGGRGCGADAGIAQVLLPEQGFERVQAVRDLAVRFPVVLDHEDGFRVAFDEVPLMGGRGRGFGQVQYGLVGEFHGGGIGLQDLDRRFHGFDQVREMTNPEGLVSRQRHQVDARLGHRDQGALGPDDHLAGIEGTVTDEFVQVVSAHAPHDPGIPGLDLVPVLVGDAADFAKDPALQAAECGLLAVFAVAGRLEDRPRAVAQDHVEFQHVVDRLPVDDGMGTAGVVADHAADVRPVARGNVRGEEQSHRFQVGVEFVEHHAGLDPGPLLLDVDLEDPVHVPGEVDLDAAAYRLAAQAGSSAAGRDGNASFVGETEDAGDVVRVGGIRDAQRLDFVDAGVRTVQDPGRFVESERAVDLFPDLFLPGCVHVPCLCASPGDAGSVPLSGQTRRRRTERIKRLT